VEVGVGFVVVCWSGGWGGFSPSIICHHHSHESAPFLRTSSLYPGVPTVLSPQPRLSSPQELPRDP